MSASTTANLSDTIAFLCSAGVEKHCRNQCGGLRRHHISRSRHL